MIRTVLTASLILSFSARAQSTKSPSFEVASVKPTPPNSLPAFAPKGGPGTDDPGRITYRNSSMLNLVMTAYGLRLPYELSGPAWLDKEKYAIEAKIPTGATKQQLNLMLINLLEERFQMKIHRETKSLPIYELAVVKRGLIEKAKLESLPAPQQSTPPPPPEPGAGVRLNRDPRPPQLPPGLGWALIPRACAPSADPVYCGHARILARAQSSRDIADMVRSMLGRLTIDKTGLTGKYDFAIDFAPETVNIPSVEPTAAPAVDPYPAFAAALKQQLGLEIKSKKGPVSVVVIDRLEKVPTEN